MAENIAQVHRREGHTYSAFHQGLTEANEGKAYALGHIYTKENVRHLLQKKKLVGEKLAKNYFLGNGYSLNSEKETLLDVLIENVYIDVWAYVVWVWLPAWLPVTETEEKLWITLDPKVYRVRDGKKMRRNPYGLCRFFSKSDFIQALIDRNSDLTEGQLSYDDELSYIYIGSEKYVLNLEEDGIYCSCCGYSGLQKGFLEDNYLLKRLQRHPVMMGELPDKHVLAVWRELGAKNFIRYQFEYYKLVLQQYGLSTSTKFCTSGNRRLLVERDRQPIGRVWKRFGNNCKSYWYYEPMVSLSGDYPQENEAYSTLAEAAIALLETI